MRGLLDERELTVGEIRARAAGLVWRVSLPGPAPAGLPDGWIEDPGRADVCVEVVRGAPVDPPGRPAVDAEPLWRLWRQSRSTTITLHAARAPAPFARVDWSPRFGKGCLRSDAKLGPFPLRWPLDQIWAVHRLGVLGGLVLHAAAVEFGGGCDLLVGPSGAGKSTLAALLASANGRPLSDDRVVLRPGPSGFWAHGTPWNGTAHMRATSRAVVRRVFFLRHGPEPRQEPVAVGPAVARLAACAFFAGWSRPLAAAALGTMERLARCAPCFELEFPPDLRAVEAIQATARAA